MYVYVLLAQTVADVYPPGGDVRYLVSADGSNIIETRQLHKSIMEVKHSALPGSKVAGGAHSHGLTDTPQDTDVFHVLRQKRLSQRPSVPRAVFTWFKQMDQSGA